MAKVCDITLKPNPTHEVSIFTGIGAEGTDLIKTFDLCDEAYSALVTLNFAALKDLTHPSLRVKNPKKAEAAKKAGETRRRNRTTTPAAPAVDA